MSNTVNDAVAQDLAVWVGSEDISEGLEKLTKNAMFCPAGLTVHEVHNASTLPGCEIDFSHLVDRYVGETDIFRRALGNTTAFIHRESVPNYLSQLLQFASLDAPAAKPWIAAFTQEGADSVMPLARSLLEGVLLTQQASLPALGAVHNLFALSGLPAGWDGYGSSAIGQPVVDRAFQTLSHLAAAAVYEGVSLPRPSVGPSPDGSIHFEWEPANGFLDVECPPGPDMLSFSMQLQDGTEREGETPSPEALWAVISDIFA